MSPATQALLSGGLTFGAVLLIALNELRTLRRPPRRGGGGPPRMPAPPTPPAPGGGGGGGGGGGVRPARLPDPERTLARTGPPPGPRTGLEAGEVAMAKLQLSVAIGNYDRMRPLVDGAVLIDGVNPQYMLLDPEEIFFRAFRQADFDICELSMSSYCVKTASGTSPYIAVPVFPSRAFRHTSVYVRTDRIRAPADLKGKRVGLPEYQLTANVWVRLFLEEDYGVRPQDVTWVRGGYETPGRVEKIGLNLPPGVRGGGRAGRRHDLRTAGVGRGRCGDRSPRAVLLRPAGAERGLPVPRPAGRGVRTGTGAPGCSPSCTRSASAAPWPSGTPSCRPP